MKKNIDIVEKAAAKARREQEIAEHGKQIWLRKSCTFESKKTYKRNKKVDVDE